MDESTITQLLNNASNSTTSLFDVNEIVQSLTPFLFAITAVSILIALLYLIGAIGKWRANKAILDIKKVLIEMNERSKSAAAPTPQAVVMPEDIIETPQVQYPKDE